MKFCKKYQEFMENQEQNLPAVGFKKLKKTLKKCRKDLHSSHNHVQSSQDHRCEVCDGTFFPSLLAEMSTVVGCFNDRAQRLMEMHLLSGFRKYLNWFKAKTQHRDHAALIQQGKDLVTYALINAVAVRKILKKYDKIHYSKQGQAFKSEAQKMHVEILQSPWLCELMALHINLRETTNAKSQTSSSSSLFESCSLVVEDGNPSLTCELFGSVKLDIDLTCSICLDTVFDPVALTCGHIFCYMCACSAASVTIVDGLKSSDHRAKCPLCRERGVYKGYVRLEELSILLRRSCHEYWEERLQTERHERVKQAKEHWEAQCRAFMGV